MDLRAGVVLIGAFLLAACGGAPVDPAVLGEPPQQFWIVGQASGADAEGRTVECVMELIVELQGETDRSRVADG